MHKSPIFLDLEKWTFIEQKAYIHPDVNMPPYYIILYQLSYPGKDDWLASCIYETNTTVFFVRCRYNTTEAPNENIVQNHLNIALLNVLQYLNGRYKHICIP